MRRLNDVVPPAAQYFESKGQKIDWDNTGESGLVSISEYEAMCEIKACEASIFVLRNTIHGGDYFEAMINIHHRLVKAYNKMYKKKYKPTNDYLGS